MNLAEMRKIELEALEKLFALIPKKAVQQNFTTMQVVENAVRQGQQARELLRSFRQFQADHEGEIEQWNEMADKLIGPPVTEEETENEETETSAEPVGA